MFTLLPIARSALALAVFAGSAAAASKVIAVDVDGMIHPITVEIVQGAIERAKAEHAELLIIRLNTPGGLMEAMRDCISKIVSSPVPVVTYVAPSGGRAASAGFFILESGDIAAMAPGTNTGAAHPVSMGGEMDPTMKVKVENDAAAYMRSICGSRAVRFMYGSPSISRSSCDAVTLAWSPYFWSVFANTLPSGCWSGVRSW